MVRKNGLSNFSFKKCNDCDILNDVKDYTISRTLKKKIIINTWDEANDEALADAVESIEFYKSSIGI